MSQKRPNDQEPIKLTPEEFEAVQEAKKFLERGEGYTAEEALELARTRTKAWQEAPLKNRSA